MTIKEYLKGHKHEIDDDIKMTFCARDINREAVRIFYNHTCQGCGKKWLKGQRRFDIHHQDCKKEKSRQTDSDEYLYNLTVLCHKCHLNIPEHIHSMTT